MNDPELLNTWKAYNNMIEEAKLLNLQSWALKPADFCRVENAEKQNQH
jgi:hypothetical protein